MENIITDDAKHMGVALNSAKKAASNGDIPVGAVIVDKEGSVVSIAYNKREVNSSALAHAEIEAIDAACKKTGNRRLAGCKMYVTLEPCPMCAGAILNSQIDTVFCAVKNPKEGSFGSVIDLNKYPFNHKCSVKFGICSEECGKILSDFFKKCR